MTITTNWVQNVYLYTNTTIYELNNPSQRRRLNQVKNEQSCDTVPANAILDKINTLSRGLVVKLQFKIQF